MFLLSQCSIKRLFEHILPNSNDRANIIAHTYILAKVASYDYHTCICSSLHTLVFVCGGDSAAPWCVGEEKIIVEVRVAIQCRLQYSYIDMHAETCKHAHLQYMCGWFK